MTERVEGEKRQADREVRIGGYNGGGGRKDVQRGRKGREREVFTERENRVPNSIAG